SLSSAQFNLGRVIGPALAGLVIHFGSYTWAFAINAASFGAVMVALSLIDVDSPRAAGEETLWRRITNGIRIARDEPGCRTALGLGGVLAITCSPFIALIPAIAVVVLQGDAGTTSVLVTAQG